MQNFKILHETKSRLRLKIVGFREIDASALQKSAARLEGVTEAQAKEALRLASHKLPVRCKFVVKNQEAKGGDE